MKKTIFKIQQMDCPSEEQMVRMKLEGFKQIKKLNFDLSNRTLGIYHNGNRDEILTALESLDLGTKLVLTEETEEVCESEPKSEQRKLLWTVLIINVSFFVIEMTTGIISNSMGLVADSLDMLADGIVYGLSLFAVGGTVARKKSVARYAGILQAILAVIGLIEVIRRFVGIEELPDFTTMIIVSILALGANVVCLYLLQKGKSKEAHMKASQIFSSNDVVINSGVIIAGLLVNWLNSSYPDLIIGGIVFIIVARGAFRIFKLSK